MIRLNHVVVTFVVAVIMSASVSAQVQIGVPKYASMGGGPADRINLGSLNVDYQIPVRHKAGRGLAFNFDLNFDSSVWEPVFTGSSWTWGLLSDLGWSGSSIDIGFLQDNYSTDGVEFDYDCVVYFDGVGSGHSFPQCAAFDFVFGIDYPIVGSVTTDGTGYTLSYDPFVTGTGQLTTVEGNSIIPRNEVPLGQGVKAGSDIDRNGNEISISTAGTFTDTLGTSALTQSGGCTSLSSCTPYLMSFTAPSGGTASVTVSFKSYTVRSNFGCSGISEFGATTIDLVDKITLPDGSFYQLTYEATPGFTGDVTARVASMRLPTGGTTSYAYSGGHNGIECTDGTAAGFTRTTPDGVWTYARTLGTGNASTTTVTNPAGNQTVISFQKDGASTNNTLGFFEVQRLVYQGSSVSGTLLQTTNTCYNGSASPCTATAVSTPLSQRSAITILGSVQKKHVELYNSTYGMLTETDDYDYGSGAPGSLQKKAIYSYPSNLGNIKAFWSTVTVQNGSGVTLSQTTNKYDETAVVATSGTPQHVSVGSASRGNLTSVTQLVQGATTLKKTNTYFDTGNLDVATDVNGAQTTYTYGACGNSFATSVSEPLSLSTSAVWNCTGGVETSVTDENGKSTTSTYTDSHFWRPASTADPTGATTTYCYGLLSGATCTLNPNETEATLSFNAGASVQDVFQTLDSLGRPFLTQVRQAPGSTTFDSTETYYNNLGQNTGGSLPYSGTAGQTTSAGASPKTSFDALGRASQVTDAGGGSLTYTYTNNDAFVTLGPAPTGENTKRKQLEYDGLGRLTSVCEVTGASGSGTCVQKTSQTGYWTQYTYDALSDLTGVTQNAQSSSKQTRTYTYDGLRRMTSETNGESGKTTYTFDTDTTCGTSSGDPVKKIDAVGNTTCLAYDKLHRPTAVTYPSGSYASSTAQKHFVYDATTFTCANGANVKKRLAEAYTGTSTSKITDLGYCYSPRGEVTDTYESTPHSGGFYHLTSAYWADRLLNTISGLPGLPTLTYGVDGEGRPSTISASSGQNPLKSTVYNTASEVTALTFGSLDNDAFTFDSNTLRMKQYQFNVGSTPESVTGALTWNANGTLGKLAITDQHTSANTQTCAYTYDDLGRVITDNCGTPWSQTFSFDAFGNINKTGSSSFVATYNSASNHLTLVGSLVPTYDANGNLTFDAATSTTHKYTWDTDGNMLSVDGTTVTLTYDALDRMVEQARGTTYTQIVYSPSGAKLGLMNGQTMSKAYVPLVAGAEAVYVSGSLNYYRHPDWLGSGRVGSGTGRGWTFDINYAAYGEEYNGSTTSNSFTGQKQDTSTGTTGLYDFLYREYRQAHGRWISPDPAGKGAVSTADPQSWNRYAYVANRPLNNVDPQGLDDCGDWSCGGGGGCDWCEWGGGGFGGGWFPGMPVGIVLPGQLPQQPSPCNYIVCADSGGIDNLTNVGTAQNPIWRGDSPWEQLCPPGQPCLELYWDPNTQQWKAPQPVSVNCDDNGHCTSNETVNVTDTMPPPQPILSPTGCLWWQGVNWQLRGVGLYATAIGVTAEVGVPLLILNLASTVAQSAVCSGGGATHW
jgi:RHS repeat-associated protein